MAGYSGTPLPKKLGIREGHVVAILGEPASFRQELTPLPADVRLVDSLPSVSGDYDVIVLFAERVEALRESFSAAAKRLSAAGGLWTAWPKKTSGRRTDLDFGVVQRIGLERGLVDNKVCAVNDVYSGLRFVVRKEDRRAWAAGTRLVES